MYEAIAVPAHFLVARARGSGYGEFGRFEPIAGEGNAAMTPHFAVFGIGPLVLATLAVTAARADDPWLVFDGSSGPGKGKHVVLISGDEEYRSEETLPQLAKILAQRHGFKCTVLFAIDPKDGTINPNVNDNIPGLDRLDTADLVVMFLRFRDLPDEQMAPIVRYFEAGKPIVGLRTSTHAFNFKKHPTHAAWSFNSKVPGWEGGFGRRVLGETWISHHGQHGKQSTRGMLDPRAASHPVLSGLKDGAIWGPTDVYGVRLPLPEGAVPLVLGQVVQGMQDVDPPASGKVNDPMMPIAWTKNYTLVPGKTGRVFTSTMGASQDFANAGVRRLLVNACFWAAGLEAAIRPDLDVGLVGDFQPLPFSFNGFAKGRKPADLR